MTYQLMHDDDNILSGIKLTQDDGLMKFIPLDKANTDYQEYLKWVAKGNKAIEADKEKV
jgi:hypothetical protein